MLKLLEELELLKEIDHPNILKILEHYEDDQHHFFVTEWFDYSSADPNACLSYLFFPFSDYFQVVSSSAKFSIWTGLMKTKLPITSAKSSQLYHTATLTTSSTEISNPRTFSSKANDLTHKSKSIFKKQ